MSAGIAVAPVSLDAAREEQVDALAAADALRARLAAGDPDLDPAELDEAERRERHAERAATAAEKRDAERREREAAAALEVERAEVQREWRRLNAGEPEHVTELRAAAAEAAAAYLAAHAAHLDEVDAMRERAKVAGFRVGDRGDFRRSPIPKLAKAILSAARGRADWSWLNPRLDQRGSIWEVG